MPNSAVQLDHDAFFRAFLSPPHIKFRAKRASPRSFASLKCADDLEDSISQYFIAAVRTHNLTPGSTLTTTPFDPVSMGREDERRTHAAMYRSTEVPKRGHPHWADQKVSLQFSDYVACADPFEDEELDELYTEAGRERKRLRERIHAVARLLFAAQQRVFLFMVLVIGRRFRLLRLDRAGVITTPSVDYVEQVAVLSDCLQRLSLLNDLSLGFDPTAVRLRPHDADFLRMDANALDNSSDVDHTERRIEEGEIGDTFVFRHVRSLFRDSLSADWPRYRLRIQDRGDTRDYLIGKPLHLSSDFIGRGTCGYVALDCETEHFVWLKDTWRASDLVTEREGDILGKLNLADVANIPTLVCHDDVQDQATVTNEWWEIIHGAGLGPPSGQWTPVSGRKRNLKRDETTKEDAPSDETQQAPPTTARQLCPLRRHTHYRMVVEEVCMPFTKFRSGKQLASISLDCLHAHHQAATNPKTQLLHRDIRSDNMLIYPNIRLDEDGKGQSIVWTGILAGWELAKPIETGRLLQENLVSTHKFMSVNILCDPLQPVTISDELEAFFHVLVYYAVLHLRSNCPNPESWINTYFFACGIPENGIYFGGMKTIAMYCEGRLMMIVPPFPLFFNSPMDRLLGGLLKSFATSYKVAAHDSRKARPPSPFWSSSSAGSSPGTDNTDSQGAATKRVKPHVPTPDFSDDSDYEEVIAKRKRHKPHDNTPTAEQRELARRVVDHTFALDFIAGLLRHKGWSDDDRRIPIDPVPASGSHLEPEPASADVDAAPAPKRRRKAAEPKEKTTGAASAGGTLTARRPATARGSRNQTRATSSKARRGWKS